MNPVFLLLISTSKPETMICADLSLWNTVQSIHLLLITTSELETMVCAYLSEIEYSIQPTPVISEVDITSAAKADHGLLPT